MVRFSCFQVQNHFHKHKKTVHRSSETMQKNLEDSSQNQVRSIFPCSAKEIKPCLKEEREHNDVSDRVTDYGHTLFEKIETKYSADNDITVHDKPQMKKSQSLGSGLNWEQRTSGNDDLEYEIKLKFSYEGSPGRSKNELSLSDHFPEPVPSDCVQVGSDIPKHISIFSIGDPQLTEKEVVDEVEDDVYLSGVVGDRTPHIVRSSSLPRMGYSPNRCSTSLVVRSRSAEDLNALDSRKEDTERVHLLYQERDSMFNNDKNNGESPADETDEAYNYLGSSKDWIIPVSDGENTGKRLVGETSTQNWDVVPAKDFRLKRIEEWVTNLQYYGPMEESSESKSPCHDDKLMKGDDLVEGPAAAKSGFKVSPGMAAAKGYISSMNASATAAQLTNLGLVVIPFLSVFVSLKALNLSGNSIVRIAAGALPRGLHILNLAKNNISTIEGLRDLTRLRVLDLSYNRILRIGHGLAACSSLKELYLAGNKISEVEGLHRLLKLNVLDLRFNKISTTKCLGQLAANYNCLQAISLEGNPAQKNVGDEQLKRYVQSLLPHLTYYNRQSIKVGAMKDAAERSARLAISSHQVDRGLRMEVKTTRKGTHGIVAQKVLSSSSNHGRKSQCVVSTAKSTRSRHGRLPPSGMKTTSTHRQGFGDVSSKVIFSFPRSRSEGNLGAL